MVFMLLKRLWNASPIPSYWILSFHFILPGTLSAHPDNELFPFRLPDTSTCIYYNRQGDVAIRLKCSDGFVADLDSGLPDFIQEAMGEFSGGLAPVRFPDGKWRFIDASGNRILPASDGGYEHADRFSDGLARVRVNGLYGYIDRTGRMVIPARFSRSGRFVQGLAPVQCDTGVYNYGYIDRSGKTVLPCKYQEASHFTSDGLARTRMWDLYGYIDRQGRTVLNFAYKLAGNFNGGLCYVLKDGGFVFIDRNGKPHISIVPFDLVGDFGGDLAPYRKAENLRWGYIDRNGHSVLPAVFFEAFPFSRGLALVQGPEGYTSIDSVREEATPQAPGRMAWFYIDSTGRRLFPR
jgi:hypothetical protein